VSASSINSVTGDNAWTVRNVPEAEMLSAFTGRLTVARRTSRNVVVPQRLVGLVIARRGVCWND
jgi:hypothetical protein